MSLIVYAGLDPHFTLHFCYLSNPSLNLYIEPRQRTLTMESILLCSVNVLTARRRRLYYITCLS
jgi:hypothetical protein